MISAWGVALILFVGALILAIVFISRRHCRNCGRTFHVLHFWRAHDLCFECGSEYDYTRSEEITHTTVLLISAALGILVCIENPAGAVDLAVVVLIIILARKNGRQAIASWLRLLARQSEWLDFRAARRASGHVGEVHLTSGFTLWTDVPGDWTSTVSTISAQALEEFSLLTGIPTKTLKPVRILCFGKEEAFSRYRSKPTANTDRLLGFYSGLFRKRVVVFRDMPDLARISHRQDFNRPPPVV